MARPLRIEFSGALYHITSRGNNRTTIYRGDKDHRGFLDLLSNGCERYAWVCQFVEDMLANIDSDQSLRDILRPQKLAPPKPLGYFESNYDDRKLAMALAYLSGHALWNRSARISA
jgi:hypothetical protein